MSRIESIKSKLVGRTIIDVREAKDGEACLCLDDGRSIYLSEDEVDHLKD